jgi:hypothetical protein
VVPGKIKALLGALGALTVAIISFLSGFSIVHWSTAQTTLASTEAAAFWALVAALVAHFWPGTQQQPVAIAGTFTALVTATVSLGIGFSWWNLTQAENAELTGLVSALIAVISALVARSQVTAKSTPPS